MCSSSRSKSTCGGPAEESPHLGQPGQLPGQPSPPYLLVAGLRKLPEHLIQLGLVLLQVPILLAQLLLQHRGAGDEQGREGGSLIFPR